MRTNSLALFFPIILLLTPWQIFANSLPLPAEETDGFQIVSLDSGGIVQEKNASEQFMPASTAKILTTIYALEILGPDFRYKTEIFTSGVIKNGKLKGDLYLKGSGDPLLLANDLFNLALELKAKGINEITGNFYYDQSALPAQNTITACGQYETTDNPGLSALNVEFNRFKVFNQIGPNGMKKLIPVPTIPHLLAKYSDRALPIETPQIRQIGLKEEWLFDPNQNYRFPVHLPVKEVAPYTAQFFREIAKIAGVIIPEIPSEKKVPKIASLRAIHRSIPLIQIVDLNLEYSNNLIAEVLLLTAASKEKKVSTLKEASERLRPWLAKFSADQTWGQAQLVCGSGLDEGNQFTPAQLTKLLYTIRDKKYGERFYRSILSVSGVKGWMYKRLDTPAFAYRAWAKTGTLDFSGGLAGYFYANSGKSYAFTLLSSNRSKRQKMLDAKGAEKVKLMDEADLWTKNIRDRHDQILKEWIEKL